MKKIHRLISSIALTVMFTACVTSESEMLKQARSIQDATVQSASSLDSSLNSRLTKLLDERNIMAQDSTLSTDSLKMQSFSVLKGKIENLETLQGEIKSWKAEMKLLPTVKEIESGTKNPFGEKAKDQEILSEIKKTQEAFNTLKMKADAAMK
jgi:HD superfamily phosphohydrolase